MLSSFAGMTPPFKADFFGAGTPFRDESPFAGAASSFRLASVSGSKVSLRNADLCLLARGSLMESSESGLLDRFGRKE